MREGRLDVARWILDHPTSHSLCDDILPDLEVDVADPFATIGRLTDVCHVVPQQVRREGRPLHAARPHSWLLIGFL